MENTCKHFWRVCALALSCVALANSLMAFPQQWTVDYTCRDQRCTSTYMWNAGRMNIDIKVLASNGSTLVDESDSFASFEVALSDPKEEPADDDHSIPLWDVLASCREGSSNKGECVTTTHRDTYRGDSAGRIDILFTNKKDTVDFVKFWRK